jgi:HEAT repeat protein
MFNIFKKKEKPTDVKQAVQEVIHQPPIELTTNIIDDWNRAGKLAELVTAYNTPANAKWQGYIMEAIVNDCYRFPKMVAPGSPLHEHVEELALQALLNRTYLKDAIGVLGYSKSEKAIQPLLGLLKEPDSDIRKMVLRTLAELKGPGISEVLVEQISDPDVTYRKEVIHTLSEIGDKPAVTALLACLDADDGNVRGDAMQVLGKLKVEAAFPLILAAVEGGDFSALMDAIVALGRYQRPETLPHILKYRQHADENIRMRVYIALGEIGIKCSKPKDRHAVWDALQVGRKETNGWARSDAERSIRDLGWKLAVKDADPAKTCTICGKELNFERKVGGIMFGDQFGELLLRSAYKCRQCGTLICRECAEKSKCKKCGFNTFDVAIH